MIDWFSVFLTEPKLSLKSSSSTTKCYTSIVGAYVGIVVGDNVGWQPHTTIKTISFVEYFFCLATFSISNTIIQKKWKVWDFASSKLEELPLRNGFSVWDSYPGWLPTPHPVWRFVPPISTQQGLLKWTWNLKHSQFLNGWKSVRWWWTPNLYEKWLVGCKSPVPSIHQKTGWLLFRLPPKKRLLRFNHETRTNSTFWRKKSGASSLWSFPGSFGETSPVWCKFVLGNVLEALTFVETPHKLHQGVGVLLLPRHVNLAAFGRGHAAVAALVQYAAVFWMQTKRVECP